MMNGFQRSFMGQVPLVLGPSSWGAGMFPPPYYGGAGCPEGTFMDENGMCRPRVTMGQAERPTCEKTEEGGYRCSDGTYLPPGCAPGSPQTVKAAPPPSDFPYLTVGLVAAGAAGALALLAGKRMGVTALETEYPRVVEQLRDYASKIESERAADAFNFQQYSAASKKRLDLVFAQKAAEEELAKQERIWEQAHRNQDELVAATQAAERIRGELAAAAEERDIYQRAIQSNQQNISIYIQNATVAIQGLPPEFQAEARAIIFPCPKPPGMNGSLRARPLMGGRF